MPFAPGNKLGKGRPAGSGNQKTAELREKMAVLLEKSLESLLEDLPKLSPKEKIDVATLASRYVIPVPKEVDEQGNSDQVIVIKGNLIK